MARAGAATADAAPAGAARGASCARAFQAKCAFRELCSLRAALTRTARNDASYFMPAPPPPAPRVSSLGRMPDATANDSFDAWATATLRLGGAADALAAAPIAVALEPPVASAAPQAAEATAAAPLHATAAPPFRFGALASAAPAPVAAADRVAARVAPADAGDAAALRARVAAACAAADGNAAALEALAAASRAKAAALPAYAAAAALEPLRAHVAAAAELEAGAAAIGALRAAAAHAAAAADAGAARLTSARADVRTAAAELHEPAAVAAAAANQTLKGLAAREEAEAAQPPLLRAAAAAHDALQAAHAARAELAAAAAAECDAACLSAHVATDADAVAAAAAAALTALRTMDDAARAALAASEATAAAMHVAGGSGLAGAGAGAPAAATAAASDHAVAVPAAAVGSTGGSAAASSQAPRAVRPRFVFGAPAQPAAAAPLRVAVGAEAAQRASSAGTAKSPLATAASAAASALPPTGLAHYAAVMCAEAGALVALSAAAATARAQVLRALAAAAARLADETPGADAAAAAAQGTLARNALAAAAAEAAARDAARAARPAAREARRARVAADIALEELDSERRKATLRGLWTPASEARHAAATATWRAAAAAADAAKDALESDTLRTELMLECYPEESAAAACVAALACADASAATSADSATLGSGEFEEVDVLRASLSRSISRCRRRSAPGAPDACLKASAATEREAFLAEARHLALLGPHPLIVRFEGAFIGESGRGVLVTPFHARGSLRGWTEELKTHRGALGAADWAAVRRVFGQLAHALEFVHAHGIAHRNIKPEALLWGDDGQTIALTSFGLSRDMSAALETTRDIGGRAYAAPEAATPAWAQHPFAGDIWSYGMMALEVASGALHAWTGRRLEVAGSGEEFMAPQKGCAAQQDCVSLALGALAMEPPARPSAGEALLHPFFSAAEDAHGVADGAALAAKLGALAAAGCAAPTDSHWVLALASASSCSAEDNSSWATALLDAVAVAPHDALARPWRVTQRRAPATLSAVMRAFWAAAPRIRSLLTQSPADGPPSLSFSTLPLALRIDLPFLPVQAYDTFGASFRMALPRFEALGRVIGKCVQEMLPVGVEFAPTAFAALLGREGEALAQPGSALAHAAAWDEAAAAVHRTTLATRLGAGGALLTRDTYLGNGDETPVCDANKSATICAALAAQLVGCRGSALGAMRKGFLSVTDAAGLTPALTLLDEWELGTLLAPADAQFVDAAALQSRIVWASEWPADEPQRAWLAAFIAALSEPALRLLLARVFGRMETKTCLLVARRPLLSSIWLGGPDNQTDVAPRLQGNGTLELVHACPSAEAFTARMLRALGLREAAVEPRMDASADDARAQQRATIAALQATGQVRRGAVYACPNGHLYTVGNCGGPTLRATCNECGAAIGGENHQPAAGNVVRLDVDGAAAPAWPQPH